MGSRVTNGERRGLRFELQVLEALERQHPHETFQHDIFVAESDGERNRQVDIYRPMHDELIECKHFKRRVDVSEIDAFMGKMMDLNVRRGTLVSASGFTAGALKRAAKARIKCRHFGFLSPKDETLYQAPIINSDGDCYYEGDYGDLCQAAGAYDSVTLIWYVSESLGSYPLISSPLLDWGDRPRNRIVADAILGHQLGERPSRESVDEFLDEYGSAWESGFGWKIEASAVWDMAYAN